MDDFVSAEALVIELMLLASIVAIVVQRLRIPYTVALVVVGLLIAWQGTQTIEVSPSLILGLFIPPLVFEAAFRLNLRGLIRDLPMMLLLAIPGVVLCMLLVALTVNVGAGITMGVALVFGALVSATDPVSVVAMFRALNVHHRLSLLVEGESLLNDGTAIVIFNLALAALLSGAFSPAAAVGRLSCCLRRGRHHWRRTGLAGIACYGAH